MTHKWPKEQVKEANTHQNPADTSFKTKDDFLALIDAVPDLPTLLAQPIDGLLHYDMEVAELERLISEACTPIETNGIADYVPMLMTLACALALAKEATLASWKRIRRIKSHSWQVEHWLTNAMLAHAQRNGDARKRYLALAKAAFMALDDGTLQSQWERANQERANALAYWNECNGKLDEIWWELRFWQDFMSYQEEFPLLNLLGELASDESVALIGQSRNPFLVRSALLVNGVDAFTPRFACWETFARDAPVAFENDGAWNSLVLLPLLLAHARRELLHIGTDVPRFDASDTVIEKAKQDIANLVDAVAEILASRPDAHGLFARWSTWLMRQRLSQADKEAGDIRSSAYVDDQLIDAIGCRLKGQAVIPSSPPDAPAWEAWCYRGVLASHAHEDIIDPPEPSSFLHEWVLSHDEWPLEKGRNLRERASLLVSMTSDMPGQAAHLLAYPIVCADQPTESWMRMWASLYPLREIVEFGDADASHDRRDAQSDASGLLLLAFRIGLAIFDQRAGQCPDSTLPTARSLADLHRALASAVQEMREIDDTLSREKWQMAFRHLAIRRFIWERAPATSQSGKPSVFEPKDSPAFGNYLIAVQNDPFDLVALLASAVLNDIDTLRMKNELLAASINLPEVLAIVRRLNHYNQRKFPIDEGQLRAIERLA